MKSFWFIFSGEGRLGTAWLSGKLVCAVFPAPPGPLPFPGLAAPSSWALCQLPPCRLCKEVHGTVSASSALCEVKSLA